MENQPLIDMTPETIQKRKDVLSKVEKLAEEVWESMDNEGDENEKQYWVCGFIVGFNIGKD
jgi:hypothetical protein